MNPEPFFKYAREREAIRIRRESEGQSAPWTDDPVLHKYRFCNVFRDDDRVTRWFREHVRDPLRDKPEVLLATVLFRFFNRITTGEAIFRKPAVYYKDGQKRVESAWELRRGHRTANWIETLNETILEYCSPGPYVTGSYIIKSPNGMDKLTGVLWAVEQFATQSREFHSGQLDLWKIADFYLNPNNSSSFGLEDMWSWLRQFPYLGDFTAYEVVTDLRHTALLENAPDIMTWANPGPGAMRGLNRLYGRDLNKSQPKHVFITEMRDLLGKARTSSIWPINPSHRPVEMRDIEHTLCEFDKYERARLGQGKPRGVYPHG